MDIKKSMEYKGYQPVYLHTADSSITWISQSYQKINNAANEK